MAVPTTRITMVKRFTYRGDTAEEFSNSYIFTGPTPSGPTVWEALYAALKTEERKIFDNDSAAPHIIGAYGYISVDPTAHAVWSIAETVPVAGTLAGVTTEHRAPGDTAMLGSWKLDRKSVKGKTVYLRKYWHGVLQSTGQVDALSGLQQVAINGLITKLSNGTFVDARKITDRLGSDVIDGTVHQYVTTRTLKRRGKRP